MGPVGGRGRADLPPFEAFLERHRRTVYRFLLAAVGPAEVDDVFQETFLAALRAYPSLRHGERLDRWILRIATRKAIDAHRARARRPVPSEAARDMAEERPAPPTARLDGDDPLWRAVRALPPRQRAAVVHRHVLDRSYAEIAALMDCSEEAARANVHQGVKRLRELVGER
ncbi:MAG TPA: RNA polymerase sigma factor [Actinomycetota bacterium]|nr:RNA polymerase sigma factor [Actinomycetota bacterium]